MRNGKSAILCIALEPGRDWTVDVVIKIALIKMYLKFIENAAETFKLYSYSFENKSIKRAVISLGVPT